MGRHVCTKVCLNAIHGPLVCSCVVLIPYMSLALLGLPGSALGMIGTGLLTPEPEEVVEGLGSGVVSADLFSTGEVGSVDELPAARVFADERDFGVLELGSPVDFFSFSTAC